MTDVDNTSDRELLAIATLVLESAGYELDNVLWGGSEALLARRREKVALVTAFFSVDSLVGAEPDLVDMLVALEHPEPEIDLYLAMLTAQTSTGAMAGTIYSIAYNLRSVRRIVRLGVGTTVGDVTQALRPLLALTDLSGSAVFQQDPLAVIESELLSAGLDRDAISSHLRKFAIATIALEDHDEFDHDEESDV